MQENPVFRCPIEIWNAIFALACDRRGRTAAAICGVSRYFYEVIKPHRLNFLVIYGESRIAAFHEAMKIIPLDVPRAEHLFITFIPDSFATEAGEVYDGFNLFSGHPEETEDERNHPINQNSTLSTLRWHPTKYTPIQEDVLRGVISYHKGSLRTLTFVTYISKIGFEMFGSLPKLEDLTIVYDRYASKFKESPRVNPTSCHNRQFPLLKRLHIRYFDTSPLFRHDEFRRVAPELTHLRISGRKCYPQYDKLPPRTKVLIQMTLMSSREQEAQISHMRNIFSSESDKERTVLLEPADWEDGDCVLFEAYLDWLDVSTGRNAFWESENTVTIDQLAARTIPRYGWGA